MIGPFPLKRIESRAAGRSVGLLIACVAGIHKAILTSTPVNDDFQHLAYSRQLLAGDLPLRDFWDLSTTLQYVLSAASQLVFGHRLAAEAIVVGLCTAVAVFLVFRVVLTATGSRTVAALCAAAFILAVPRTYAYPKWIAYAIPAWLWWNYVWWPSPGKAVAAGVAAAAAFYWRHDHGVIVAAGVALGMMAAHGFSRLALRRTGLAGAVALVLVLPYLVFAQWHIGLVDLARMELTALGDEHGRSRAELRWPLRTAADLVRREPAESYAPEISVRWREGTTPQQRAAALSRYGLTPVAEDGAQAQRVRLSERALVSLRELIDDPLIDDTAGVERGRAAFSWTQWPVWDRLRFRLAWLRFSVLPGIDEQIAAGAAAAMLLHAMPLIAALLAGPSLHRRLPPEVGRRPLLLFAVFAALGNLGLLREPYEARAADVLVLPAILFGVLLVVLLRGPYRLWKWPLRIVAASLILVAAKSLGVAGEFGERVAWLAGDGQSIARARGAWREVGARLLASPPSQFWADRGGPVTVRLADYVRRCVGPGDRVLVLWFAPEIHYYADRLMAGRHLYYFAAFRSLEDVQRRELDKVMRSAPALVLANRDNYAAAVDAFPDMMRFVEWTYVAADAFDEDGDRFSVLVRRDVPPAAEDPVTGWPCDAAAGGMR